LALIFDYAGKGDGFFDPSFNLFNFAIFMGPIPSIRSSFAIFSLSLISQDIIALSC